MYNYLERPTPYALEFILKINNYKIYQIRLKYQKEVIGGDTKRPKTRCPITKSPIKKTQNYTSPKNKSPNVTNRPKTKHPNNKTPKITKSPKLQNVQGYKISKVTTFWSFCTIFIIEKVLNIDTTFHSCLYLCAMWVKNPYLLTN